MKDVHFFTFPSTGLRVLYVRGLFWEEHACIWGVASACISARSYLLLCAGDSKLDKLKRSDELFMHRCVGMPTRRSVLHRPMSLLQSADVNLLTMKCEGKSISRIVRGTERSSTSFKDGVTPFLVGIAFEFTHLYPMERDK